jgi:hypothetical protein
MRRCQRPNRFAQYHRDAAFAFVVKWDGNSDALYAQLGLKANIRVMRD